MTTAMPATRPLVRAALLLVGALFAAQLPAQSLRVTAANGTPPSAVYDTLFSPPSTTLLNADGAAYQSLQSLVFVPGSNAGVDLIAADTLGGKLVHYYAPTGTPLSSATVIWSAASQVPGPQQPDGLSVDAAGNLYVTTNIPRPQVWVLQPNPSAAGGYGAPALLDDHFAGKEADWLIDSVVVPSTLSAAVQAALAANGVHAGDVLVLVADTDHDPADSREGITVFDYSAASIAARLANPGTAIAAPATALLQSQFQQNHFASALPTGLDIWPIDGSLILATSNGQILQFTLPAASSSSAAPPLWTQATRTTFASIPCGDQGRFFKMRTGIQAGTAYVFVTQVTGLATGNILQFAVPADMATPEGGFGFVNATLTVPTSASGSGPATAGPPVGIAVAPPAVVTPAADCVSAGGCNPTGGLAHTILPGAAGVGPQGVRGNIVEQTCIVTDTRVKPDGTCPGTLNIATLCPGFPANIVPSTMCGASGPSKNQLAIVQSIANGVDDVPGIVVQSESAPAQLIPGTADPGCSNPAQVVGWTPRLGSDEGTTPEGAGVIDMTTYCDRSGGTTRGNSIWVLGGQLSTNLTSTAALTNYTNQKLATLGSVIQSGNIARPVKTGLDVCLIATAVLLNTRHYQCAARAVYDCDQFVAKNAASFGSSPDNPNPYGDVRGRLGSVFYTINSRIQKNPANPIWPLTSAPAACR
jgi:hypothetical protein